MENKKGTTIVMHRYEIGRLLGQGNFGKVYHARSLKTGQSVAIKVINKDMIMKVGLEEQIKREISIMRLVRHPNIVQLYEVMATQTKIYFAMEYVKGGELFDKLSQGRINEDTARKYFHQLITAVDFCHSRGVYHRDLKPENLLLDENGDLKVTDFGMSALIESKKKDGLLHTACGTPAYVAPEVIKKKGYDGVKADIWSCGVILFVLLAGFLPFNDNNLMHMYKKIVKADFRCPKWFPYDVKRLLHRILNPNPRTRISMTRIMENKWFKGEGCELIDIVKEPQLLPPLSSAYNYDEDISDGAPISSNKEETTMPMRPYHLNAFDIISMSSGLDLSGLFENSIRSQRQVAVFTTQKPTSVIVSKLEEIAQIDSRFKVMMKNGVVRLEGKKRGREGQLCIDAEMFEVTPFFHIVEVKKVAGSTMEYWKFWEVFKHCIDEIVWAWQLGYEQQQAASGA